MILTLTFLYLQCSCLALQEAQWAGDPFMLSLPASALRLAQVKVGRLQRRYDRERRCKPACVGCMCWREGCFCRASPLLQREPCVPAAGSTGSRLGDTVCPASSPVYLHSHLLFRIWLTNLIYQLSPCIYFNPVKDEINFFCSIWSVILGTVCRVNKACSSIRYVFIAPGAFTEQ